jgi:hypothetical protein
VREKSSYRRVWRRGPLHAYVQSQLRSDGGRPRLYRSVSNMANAQEVFIAGAEKLMPLVMRKFEHFAMEVIDETANEIEWLAEELYDRNPWAEDGPSDPPKHSAEAWKIDFREGAQGQIVISVSNPKDYMQFLEAGWSPQAPAGWIAATYREFWMRLARAVRRIK